MSACPDCGHEHAGDRLAGICVGCPCERREPRARPRPAMTFGDLKAVLATFTPDQLAMPVRWCGEERGGEIQRVDVLEEEHVVVDDRDGMEPASTYADDPEAQAEIVARWPAGTPMLCTDEVGR